MWPVYTNPEVDQFIESLELTAGNKIRYALNLLKEYGPLIRSPHSKKLVGYSKLFELRSSGNSPVRLLYTISKKSFFILRGFIKKTDKTPKKELDLAQTRIQELTSQ